MISVIIPAHNAARTLERAVSSILTQDVPADVEILIVENGSTDDTLSLAYTLAEKSNHIRVLQSPPGVSEARNLGIEQAKGDMIGWIDADDMYAPGALHALWLAHQMLDVQFVKGNLTHIFSDRTRIWRPRISTFFRPLLFDFEPAYSDFVGTVTGLYRADWLKSVSEPFPVGVHTAEDRVFVWKTLLSARRFAHIDKVVYHYDRTSETSVLSKKDGKHFDLFRAYRSIHNTADFKHHPNVHLKFWSQFISLMHYNYKEPGRLSPAGKVRWISECRQAMKLAKEDGVIDLLGKTMPKQRKRFFKTIGV